MTQAVKVLQSYIPAPGLMHHNYKLERMGQLMERLGNPQNAYKVVHVAGTSGKTSTAYFMQGLLQNAGQKTGLTVSPHIQSITERIQIDGQPISDEAFIGYLNTLLQKLEGTNLQPTYFELLMALAYLVFREEKVEYAVIETGLGGLLDATNVVTRAHKLCVITDIGLDHTDVLGKTVGEIAKQKAGIVQPGNVVVVQHQDAAVEEIITTEAKQRGASGVKLVDTSTRQKNLPLFQQRNWAVAVTAYAHLAVRDTLLAIDQLPLSDIATHHPPGRMEIFKVGNKTIILDGAHNPQKLHALVASLQAKGYTTMDVLVSFVDGKQDLLSASLQELQPVTHNLVVTDFSVLRDMGKTASSAETIMGVAQNLGFAVTQTTDPRQALRQLLDSPAQTVLVTGSLYLVAQLRGSLLTHSLS